MATYVILNLIVTALLLPVVIYSKLNIKVAIVSLIGVLLLTAIFDPVLVQTHIVAYDPNKILGITILGAPIEDFFYGIVAAFLVPAIYKLFEKRRG